MPEETKVETPTPTPSPTATPTPTPSPTATITVSPEEYKRLQDGLVRLAGIEAAAKAAADAAEAKRLQVMAEKGEIEKALTTLRTDKDAAIKAANDRADALENERLNDRKTTAIDAALLKATWADADAPAQVRQLLEPRFESVRDGNGQVVVRERGTLRPAADVIAEYLASGPAAKFLKAGSAGGAGSQGTQKGTPTPSATDAEIDRLPFDQKLVLYMKGQQQTSVTKYGFGHRPAPK